MLNLGNLQLCLGDSSDAVIKQIGVVVRDLDMAITNMKTIFGLEPIGIFETPDEGKLYAGQPEDFCARMAIYRFKNIDLELVLPLRGKSVWVDYLNDRGEGLHHILFMVKDFEKTKEFLCRNGISMMQCGYASSLPGAKFAYFDALKQLGYYLEIVKLKDEIDNRETD